LFYGALVRNLIDTHDAIDQFCDVSQTPEDYLLHRDVLGYYLSRKMASVPPHAKGGTYLDKAGSWYWGNICKSLPDKKRQRRLRDGAGLFYTTRRERLAKHCGDNADFMGEILTDLSTYVHSVPPGLWMSSLEDGFADSHHIRRTLVVWLRITNFYFARSIGIILGAVHRDAVPPLKDYLLANQAVFGRSEQ
jgi:hypothetical protein